MRLSVVFFSFKTNPFCLWKNSSRLLLVVLVICSRRGNQLSFLFIIAFSKLICISFFFQRMILFACLDMLFSIYSSSYVSWLSYAHFDFVWLLVDNFDIAPSILVEMRSSFVFMGLQDANEFYSCIWLLYSVIFFSTSLE